MTPKPAASVALPGLQHLQHCVGSSEAHFLSHHRPSESHSGLRLGRACPSASSPCVTACSRLTTTGALRPCFPSSQPRRLYFSPPLPRSSSYDKLTNLEGEGEFRTNIFNTADGRRGILIGRDLIKVDVGGSVGGQR